MTRIRCAAVSLLLLSTESMAHLRGVDHEPTKERRLKSKSKDGEEIVDPCGTVVSGSGMSNGGLSSGELFGQDLQDLIDQLDCPDEGDRQDNCLPLDDVLLTYPGIQDLELTNCLSPDDCEGECRIHSAGLVCDETGGPFPQLASICPLNFIPIPIPIPPQDDPPVAPTLSVAPSQTPSLSQMPSALPSGTPQTQEGQGNDKLSGLSSTSKFGGGSVSTQQSKHTGETDSDSYDY
mmetsp:Transcript_25849/g.60071  ORF Transcript_25849/g.60071 Transcript_25849/m.60071 type:complete len:235 (-) Transcript_25849:141-845(-)|eukprot:CAMPEP_0116845130 /NCGR_PEP_ID=MMETSP0418-20121206/13089_1 /TAXON_ID=1158023 /ORGANISM="Astrosyne radiata, Strain 13vi08-1A" /LENGTH=234 /DNA_ID=CAMNT_0004476193 /DNA_START=195 /DNA_END=899 /DNA_ORIENTATION=-